MLQWWLVIANHDVKNVGGRCGGDGDFNGALLSTTMVVIVLVVVLVVLVMKSKLVMALVIILV